jgi:hypothetical protein
VKSEIRNPKSDSDLLRTSPFGLWFSSLAPLVALSLALCPGWSSRGLAADAPLVANGDFEAAARGDRSRPAAWGKPDGLGVQWADTGEAAHGKAIRMDTRLTEKQMAESWKKAGLTNEWNIPKPEDNAIAETYGLSLYSDAIPVKPNQPYRITFDFKGPAGGGKVWVRGYGLFRGEKRRRWETWVRCNSNGDTWNTCSQVFFPTKMRPDVTEMRVMLFAYYPAAVYWFDNVRIEPVSLQAYEAARQ